VVVRLFDVAGDVAPMRLVVIVILLFASAAVVCMTWRWSKVQV